MLALCCSAGFPRYRESRLLSRGGARLLITVTSLVEQRHWGVQAPAVAAHTESTVAVHGLSWSVPRGIFLDQGSNPCLLHWQVDYLPLSHHGRLLLVFKLILIEKKIITLGMFSSVSHSVVCDICDPMDCSMPGLLVHHQLLEPSQTHVH